MYSTVVTGALITIGIIIIATPVLGRVVHIALHTRSADIADDPGFIGDANTIGWITARTAAGIHPGFHAGAKDIRQGFIERTGLVFVLQVTGVMGNAVSKLMGYRIRCL